MLESNVSVSETVQLFILDLLKRAKELGATYVEVRVDKTVVKASLTQPDPVF